MATTTLTYFTVKSTLATVVLTYNTSSFAVTKLVLTNNLANSITASITNISGQKFSGTCPPGQTITVTIPNNTVFISDPSVDFGGVVQGGALLSVSV